MALGAERGSNIYPLWLKHECSVLDSKLDSLVFMTFLLPGFLIVGAAKAGTTTMFQLLSQHPEVFLPEVKECRFFSDIGRKVQNPFTGAAQVECIKNIGAYQKLFLVRLLRRLVMCLRIIFFIIKKA